MQTTTRSAVVAEFKDRSAAQAAVDELKAEGFSTGDIFIGSNDSGLSSSNQVSTQGTGTTHHHEGGIKGWFKSIFGEDDSEERPYYEDAVNKGSVFVSVDVAANEVDHATNVLERHSGFDVHTEDESIEQSPKSFAASASGTTGRSGSSTLAGQQASIPVVQEDLQVGKRTVQRGGVRVYSRLVEKPVEEQVQLRDEHVRVDRTPVNRAATAADFEPGTEQVFEVKEYAEEAVVGKQARVVEEIRIGKDATERTETVRDTVRHTEVNVENVNAGQFANSSTGLSTSSSTPYDDDYRTNFQSNYGSAGESYESYAPSYQYGTTMASDPRYTGRSFDEVEPHLREDYGQRYPNNTWEKMKNSIRYGWDKMAGKVK